MATDFNELIDNLLQADTDYERCLSHQAERCRVDFLAARKALEDAITALAAQQDARGAWQPIETAPKDVELLLGWRATLWSGNDWKQEIAMAHCTRGGWLHGRATHWQPLPAPPQS